MIQIAQHLHFHPAHGPLSSEMQERASRHDRIWLSYDQVVLADPVNLIGPQDWSAYKQQAAMLHGNNPKQFVGMYVGGLQARQMDPNDPWVTDADILHMGAGDGRPIVHMQGGVANRIPNYGSPVVRAKLVNHYLEFCVANGFDGILLDSFSPAYYSQVVRDPPSLGGWAGASAGCLEGAAHLEGWWNDALALFGEQLRWGFEQAGKQVYVVGLSDGYGGPWAGFGNSSLVDYASGAISEHVHRMYLGAATFQGHMQAIQMATAKRRGVFFSVTPRLFSDTDALTLEQIPTGQDFERFYLACYLLIQEAPYTSYGYHPYWAYRGWDDAAQPYCHWSDDWLLDFGTPLTGTATLANGVTFRHYSTGIVVVNPNATAQQFPVAGRFCVWDRPNGYTFQTTAPDYILNVPARTGWFMWNV